jgi:hypothetical protein
MKQKDVTRGLCLLLLRNLIGGLCGSGESLSPMTETVMDGVIAAVSENFRALLKAGAVLDTINNFPDRLIPPLLEILDFMSLDVTGSIIETTPSRGANQSPAPTAVVSNSQGPSSVVCRTTENENERVVSQGSVVPPDEMKENNAITDVTQPRSGNLSDHLDKNRGNECEKIPTSEVNLAG